MNKQTDSIVRYCAPSCFDDKGKISWSAFRLRKDRAENELSVFHYEYFKNNPLKELKEHCENERHLHLNRNGYFAVMKYSNVERDFKENFSLDIDIYPDNIPHYLIKNLEQCEDDVLSCFKNNIDLLTQIKEISD